MTAVRFTDGSKHYQAMQLTGRPGEIYSVINWMVEYGLPRLVDPEVDPDKPFKRSRMVDEQGRKHTPGVYIDPKKGVLVIRTRYKSVYEADYGDWIFRDIVNNHFFVVKSIAIDEGRYTIWTD